MFIDCKHMVMCQNGAVTIHFVSGSLDPVRAETLRLIERAQAGEILDETVERTWVDLKEEAGRRGPGGVLLPGLSRDDAVAQQLASEAACMANTPGGGALIVGVANDGQLVGAVTEAEWLRQRIYEITRRLITPDVIEVDVLGVRLLVVICASAVEPVRINDRIKWRVNDKCVEVDAATWHARRMGALNYDWSGDVSTLSLSDARPQAIDVARDFLRASADPMAADLANASDGQMLRRLNVVTGDGHLTNAGALVFVGRGNPGLDYLRREYAGGDSGTRVRRENRSLVEELAEVFLALDAHNATRHVQQGLVVAQVQDIPRLAAREAIVNGVAHREWGIGDPTVVEHIGRTLRVTSPGGFFGGVNETNILTHPSTSRNRALTQLLADLHVAEREGVGVDRMVREMVRVGHQPPEIREVSGPMVRASLVGDAIDVAWMEWLGRLEPQDEAMDVNSLLLLRTLIRPGWVDALRASPLVQLSIEEARGAILKLSRATMSGAPLLGLVEGVPEGAEPVWRLSDAARAALALADQVGDRPSRWPSRSDTALAYAKARGRISSTELGSLVGASYTNVGGTLKDLQSEGRLEPSTPSGRGRGFYYRWVG